MALTIHTTDAERKKSHFFYTLYSSLAVKRITLVEIISSYTELSFIIQKQDTEIALATLNPYAK
ncbi:MAG TPA: hypothetical protein VG935_04190 [Patescibacteria group bacterium]|nr:hypothetical protein [Patescibacteria group bacterium]